MITHTHAFPNLLLTLITWFGLVKFWVPIKYHNKICIINCNEKKYIVKDWQAKGTISGWYRRWAGIKVNFSDLTVWIRRIVAQQIKVISWRTGRFGTLMPALCHLRLQYVPGIRLFIRWSGYDLKHVIKQRALALI